MVPYGQYGDTAYGNAVDDTTRKPWRWLWTSVATVSFALKRIHFKTKMNSEITLMLILIGCS